MNAVAQMLPQVCGPMLFRGFCCEPENVLEDRYLTFDFNAPPLMSGREVVTIVETPKGLRIVSKFLQYRASDETWWFAAWSTPDAVGDHSRIHAFKLDTESRTVRGFPIRAIAAITKETRERRASAYEPRPVTLRAETLAAYERESAAVVAEWQRDGYPPPRELAFENDAAIVRQFARGGIKHEGTNATDVFVTDMSDAPTGLSATATVNGIRFTYTLGFTTPKDVLELWEYTSSTPFSSATKVAEIGVGNASGWMEIHRRDETTRYYWIRIRNSRGTVTDTYPATTGLAAAADFVQTTDIELGAATDIYSTTDVGPITVSLVAPSTSKVDPVKVVSGVVLPNANCTVEVSASYRVGVTGSGFTVNTGGVRVLSGVGNTFTTKLEKTSNAYEPQTIVSTFTQAAGTYDFGLGVDIAGTGTNVDAIFRDINVRVTVIKR